MSIRPLLSVALLSAALPALAGSVTVSTDRASFEAAYTSAYTVETFTDGSHFPISTGVLNSATNLPGIGITPGMILPGVTYSTPVGNSNFFNIDAGSTYVGGFLDTVTGDRLLTVTFDGTVSSFGFDTNNLAPIVEVVVNFTDATTQTFTGSANASGMQFFGFTSAASDIASVRIGSLSNSTFSFAVDNFTFGEVSAVPEPGTYALMALGLAVLGSAAARRRT